jgi:hypothetical protein
MEDEVMSWFLAYLLLFFNLALLVFVGIYAKSWKSRVIGGMLLILPVPLYLIATGYFTAYYQHVRDCKAEGGLKVLIRSEKLEQIRLRLESKSAGESAAHNYLHEFYPHLKQVEALGGAVESIIKPNQFFTYSVISTNTSDRRSNWENEWKFNKTPTTEPSKDIYVLSEHKEDNEANNKITKYEWRLTRNDKLYAKITDYSHMWRGIQYPDAIPSWHCSDVYSAEYASSAFANPQESLLRLILK